MEKKSLIFVANPGSASRKYALFEDGQNRAGIHFEYVGDSIVGTLSYDGQKRVINFDDKDLTTVSSHVLQMLRDNKVIGPNDKIDAIGIRIVAPSRRFMQDEVINTELLNALSNLQEDDPLHIKSALEEIKQLQVYFKDVPIVAVSDSAFHKTKPERAWYYGVDTKLANKLGIERYGYHGISLGSIVGRLKGSDILMPKTIICHLGSGSSVTAVENGKSIDNTMGYSPLEGVIMATRSGSIDVSAALAIKRDLKLSDHELEQYLDKQSGLLGVSGTSDDIRQLLNSESKGDNRAELALDLFVYRIQQAIGQMAASLDGVNCLVFTGTVGERSNIIRTRITKQLSFLGFQVDKDINEETFEPTDVANIASHDSKPILVISTDEAAEIAHRTADKVKI
ncbi:acetate/propionate family kinase [Candidatus Saccharibacteria bacterium]|nr:acetate/propionate family kinase [Candidatus Saccharibacteria bacterium]